MSAWLQNSCWSAAPYSLHTKQLATQRTCPLGAYIYDGIKVFSAFPLPCPLGDIYLALFSFFFLLPSKESSDFSAWLLCSVIENKKEVGRKGRQKRWVKGWGLVEFYRKVNWNKGERAATVHEGSRWERKLVRP